MRLNPAPLRSLFTQHDRLHLFEEVEMMLKPWTNIRKDGVRKLIEADDLDRDEYKRRAERFFQRPVPNMVVMSVRNIGGERTQQLIRYFLAGSPSDKEMADLCRHVWSDFTMQVLAPLRDESDPIIMRRFPDDIAKQPLETEDPAFIVRVEDALYDYFVDAHMSNEGIRDLVDACAAAIVCDRNAFERARDFANAQLMAVAFGWDKKTSTLYVIAE